VLLFFCFPSFPPSAQRASSHRLDCVWTRGATGTILVMLVFPAAPRFCLSLIFPPLSTSFRLQYSPRKLARLAPLVRVCKGSWFSCFFCLISIAQPSQSNQPFASTNALSTNRITFRSGEISRGLVVRVVPPYLFLSFRWWEGSPPHHSLLPAQSLSFAVLILILPKAVRTLADPHQSCDIYLFPPFATPPSLLSFTTSLSSEIFFPQLLSQNGILSIYPSFRQLSGLAFAFLLPFFRPPKISCQ